MNETPSRKAITLKKVIYFDIALFFSKVQTQNQIVCTLTFFYRIYVIFNMLNFYGKTVSLLS